MRLARIFSVVSLDVDAEQSRGGYKSGTKMYQTQGDVGTGLFLNVPLNPRTIQLRLFMIRIIFILVIKSYLTSSLHQLVSLENCPTLAGGI